MNDKLLTERSLLAWFAANPVAANFLMILIVLGGWHTLQTIVKEAYPRFAPPRIEITAEYPGAGPTEVQEGVCIPIEEAVHDLTGIKRLKSVAREGLCEIGVEVEQGYSTRELSSSIRVRTQTITTLPKSLEKIEIDDTAWEYPAISVVLYGNAGPLTLRHLAEKVRDDLGVLPGVRATKIWNKNEYEISVEISSERLRQYGLTLAQVAEAIRHNSIDVAGGVLKSNAGELQLRSKHTAYHADALREIPISSRSDGTAVKLGDLATITDGFDDQVFEYWSNGQPSVTIGVMAQNDLVATAEAVREYVLTLSNSLPEGIHYTLRRDNARSFAELLDTLKLEGISGFILVFIVLLLFLSTQVAIWAAVGVMLSVFGAIWFLPMFDVSLNMLSLFGFVLAMGVLVDDAIIVSERIHELQSQGMTGLRGAIRGIQDVWVPVVLGVSIGLITFLPGLFVPPSWALMFMKPVAVVMILSLAFSLVEALLILPAHLAHEVKPTAKPSHLDRIRKVLNRGLELLLSKVYRPLLQSCLVWRYAVAAFFASAILIGWVLIHVDYVKLSLEEDISYDNFHVHLMPPLGTPYAETKAKVQEFLVGLNKAEAELNATQPPGSPSVIEGLDVFLQEVDPTIWVEFSSAARQQFHIKDLIDRWYQHIPNMGDFKPDFHTPTEQDVVDLEIEVRSPDPRELDAVVNILKEKVADFPDITEIEDSRRPGKPELRFALTPEAGRLGIKVQDLAEQVRAAYAGETVQRFIRGRDEVKIMARVPRMERESLPDFKSLPIRLPNGSQAPLGTLATFDYAPGFGALEREDRMGKAGIHAKLAQNSGIKGETVFKNLEASLFPSLMAHYPHVDISAGEAKEEAALLEEGLKTNTVIALVAIYALIAVSFRSYLQPLLFMLAVPVAWLGAVLIHGAMGLTLSFQSVIGMIAASGVVVNDSIVLLDYIQNRKGEEISLHEVIVEACTSRFRPIILVALTNLAGFLPMLFETSEQAKFLVPMTLALTFGLLFGMAATLLLIPACYAILEDVRATLQKSVSSAKKWTTPYRDISF
ncbi:nodulation protein NolG [Methyloglobulus morosus KoM1]|uniref:Nodulation protein NolG n=1 Tax=Methyloglobulus morosus KoM1 TaxID=1116472 RepID=V5BWA2_9GAMM|nr:efflux RND transporter permease subunit [Methyloglobulus morosus]ESS72124.1 nodulation protein NolG [Methyloglobulus morosus KoM1]